MKSTFWQIIVLIVAILGSGIGLAYTHHVNRQLFVAWQNLQTERDRLEIEWELLQLEQSTLVTEVAVEETARTKMNMLIPNPNDVLFITPDHEAKARKP